MSRRCCLNCHFLSKSAPDAGGQEYVFSWKLSERQQGRPEGEHWTSFCYKRVWNANRNPVPKSDVDAEISKKRKRKECPFFEYECGLNFAEVEELQSNWKTWWQRTPGIVWAALVAASLVLGIIANVIGLLEVERVEENVKLVIKWLSQLLGQEK